MTRDSLDMMDDQLITSDTTDDDDDRALGEGSSSSSVSSIINSDSDVTDFSHSHRMFLSNEDIEHCLYVTKIDWRSKFSVRNIFLPLSDARKSFSKIEPISNLFTLVYHIIDTDISPR